jgi:photosystem II stability/assembly factor-like uncharacterized protein
MKTLYCFLAIAFLLFTISIYPQWVQQNLPGDIDVTLGIDFINQDQGLLGGWHFNFGGQIFGNAFYTTDSGTNWIEASFPDSMRVIVELQMLGDSVAYGSGAYNISTAESLIGSYGNRNLSSSILNYYDQLGMESSEQEEYRGYFVETTDGGLSWHPKGSFEDSVYYLVGIHFFDQQTGFVLATGPYNNTFAAILKTSDGGNNWSYVYNFEAYLFLNEINFFDQSNGIAVGTYDDLTNSYGVVLKTTDGGNNWIRTELTQLLSLNGVTYLSSNSILISGVRTDNTAVIYRSDDGGMNWFECCIYNDLHFIAGINSVPAAGVIIVYGQFQPTGSAIPFVEVTLDGGLTWYYNLLSQFTDYYLIKSKLVNESKWYITGTQTAQMGFVLFTDNAGGVPVELVSFTAEFVESRVNLSWTTASELNNLGFEIERKAESEEWRTIGFTEGKGTSIEITNYSFTDDLFEISASRLSYRLKQIDFDGTYVYSDEVEIEIVRPVAFSLLQNYPNPFNPTTNIGFRIADFGFVSLKVYDILGNEITTLVNEELPAGEYEVEFNTQSNSSSRLVRNLTSGIYFYQLKTGNYIQTKKMILVK